MQTGINYSGLIDCSNEFKQIADGVKYILDEFISCVDSAVDDGWVGKAASHYESNASSLKPTFEQFYEQMLSYVSEIDAVVNRFKAIDNFISESFGKIV